MPKIARLKLTPVCLTNFMRKFEITNRDLQELWLLQKLRERYLIFWVCLSINYVLFPRRLRSAPGRCPMAGTTWKNSIQMNDVPVTSIRSVPDILFYLYLCTMLYDWIVQFDDAIKCIATLPVPPRVPDEPWAVSIFITSQRPYMSPTGIPRCGGYRVDSVGLPVEAGDVGDPTTVWGKSNSSVKISHLAPASITYRRMWIFTSFRAGTTHPWDGAIESQCVR